MERRIGPTIVEQQPGSSCHSRSIVLTLIGAEDFKALRETNAVSFVHDPPDRRRFGCLGALLGVLHAENVPEDRVFALLSRLAGR